MAKQEVLRVSSSFKLKVGDMNYCKKKNNLERGWCVSTPAFPEGDHTRDVATNQWWKGFLIQNGNVLKFGFLVDTLPETNS